LQDEAVRNEAPTAKADKWSHIRGGINSWGRCLKMPAKEDEEDEDYWKKQGEPKCTFVLDTIKKDANSEEIWKCSEANGVVTIRNLEWPGAYTVGWTNAPLCKYANIYVGYGNKYSPKVYTPPMPFPIMQEFTMDDAKMVEAPDPLTEPPPQDEEEEE
jgi:hypothetical protein